MKAGTVLIVLLVLAATAAAQGGLGAVAGGVASPQQPQPTKTADAPKGTGSIEGVVLSTDGDRPVRKATITLTLMNVNSGGGGGGIGLAAPPTGNTSVQTDADGHFAFNDLPAGRYNLMVQHPSYVGTGRLARMVSTQVTLANDQHVKDANFRLLAAAVIRGKITDEDGDPMPRAQVQALQQRYNRGRKQLSPTGQAQTDDLGEFRISGLAPGRYYVSAVRMNFMGPQTPASKGPLRQYVRTYYPNALDLGSASPVEVRSGDEIPLNFGVMQAETVLVRGTVLTATGDKAATGTVFLSGGGDGLSFAQSPVMISQGNFEVRVMPGHYKATAMVMADPQQPMSMTVASATLDVPAQGLEGVRLQTLNSTHVTAHVRVEGSPADFKYENVNVSLVRRSEDDDDIFSMGFNSGASARASKDGTVELDKVTPGLYDVGWNSQGGGFDNYYLKSIIAGGHDVGEAGLRVGESAAQVQLVIAANPPKIDGTVTDSSQNPVKGAYVVAIPDGELRKRDQNFRVEVTDRTGHFLLRQVRPGRYTLVALQDPEFGVWLDPEFIRSVEDRGETLSVSENDRKTTQLKVQPGTLAQPAAQ